MAVLTRDEGSPARRILDIRGWAIASLVANIGIVATGATVRLTGSGLGCPTWPQCTDASYLPHAALGIHGAIEFGNRLLTFVLSIVAIMTAIAAFSLRDRLRPRGDLRRLGVLLAIGVPVMAIGGVVMVVSDYHPLAVAALAAVFVALVVVSVLITRTTATLDPLSRRHEQLRRLSLLLALGIPAQAVIGGITVVTDLNPWVVGGHLVSSLVLIVVATWLVRVAHARPRPTTSRWGWWSARATVVALAIAVWLGTVVTGSGPHSGDEHAHRTGLDPGLMSHVHATAVYVTLALTVLTLVLVRRRAVWLLLGAELLQAAIGLVQFWTGLPIVLVALHVLGSALLAAAGANLVWATAPPASVPAPETGPERPAAEPVLEPAAGEPA